MLSRREMLRSMSSGFGAVALAGLCAEEARAAKRSPLSPKQPHFEPRAKRVIFLCMRGGPAQVDTFDYKPGASDKAGQSVAKSPQPKKGKYGGGRPGSVLKFNQAGESGLWMSEIFPQLTKHADELCVINSMHTNVPNHPQSFLMMHSGDFRFPRPSVGSWILYGLGTENQDLPGFITINPPTRVGGAQNYATAFLPPIYQGTNIGYIGADIAKATIGNVAGDHLSATAKRKQMDLIQQMNQDHLRLRKNDDRLDSVIESMELGFRMQSSVPDVMDVSSESAATLEAYGIGVPRVHKDSRSLDDDFGQQCLMARRFAEAGVRYIEICHSNWDQHGKHRAGLRANGEAIDQPITALITDLKQRDMLKDTLLVWAGEFGRTPIAPAKDGSGHNSAGFSVWMAGGGVRGGMAYGETDETGARAVENRVHVHDLHATMLHLLGMDHTRLTYRHAGRDFRLTDVYGNVVKDILT